MRRLLLSRRRKLAAPPSPSQTSTASASASEQSLRDAEDHMRELDDGQGWLDESSDASAEDSVRSRSSYYSYESTISTDESPQYSRRAHTAGVGCEPELDSEHVSGRGREHARAEDQAGISEAAGVIILSSSSSCSSADETEPGLDSAADCVLDDEAEPEPEPALAAEPEQPVSQHEQLSVPQIDHQHRCQAPMIDASGLSLLEFLHATQLSQFENQLLDMGATLPEDLGEIMDDELFSMGMNASQVKWLRCSIESGQLHRAAGTPESTPLHRAPGTPASTPLHQDETEQSKGEQEQQQQQQQQQQQPQACEQLEQMEQPVHREQEQREQEQREQPEQQEQWEGEQREQQEQQGREQGHGREQVQEQEHCSDSGSEAVDSEVERAMSQELSKTNSLPLKLNEDTTAKAELSSSERGSGHTCHQQGRRQQLMATDFSWTKLKECKLSVLMGLMHARDSPQRMIDRVLDSHDPRHTAVRMLRCFENTGEWPGVDNTSDTVSEMGCLSSDDTSDSTSSATSATESCTTTASSQTGTASAASSTSQSEDSSYTSSGSASSESDDEAVHPLIQEAADAIWFKLKLEGGQRDYTPAQLFAAARDRLAMPQRPPHLRLEEEALLLCPIMSIEVGDLRKFVRRQAKARELTKQRKAREREHRRERKANAKALKLLRNEIDDAIGCGDLEKVIDVQGRVAQAEHDGVSVDALGGAMEQLANYAAALAGTQTGPDEAAATAATAEESAKKDEANGTAGFVDEEDALDIDMRGWYDKPDCAEALARLLAELIYLRPATTSPFMALVLAFDEMFANGESLFVKTMSTDLRQQALHKTNVEKRSRGTKMERESLNMGYVVPVGKREFFFSCLTEAEVLKLFDAVRQAYRTEWRVRAAVAQKERAEQRLPKDQEMARELPAYKRAIGALLACDELPQTDDFQAGFKKSVEIALGAEDSTQYEELRGPLSARLCSLLDETREAYQEGWRRVCATKHPRCMAAVKALAQSPAVPTSFQRTVEKELCYALVCADAEQFEQLLLGSSSNRFPPAVRKHISDAMLAFDDEKARLDKLASEEQLKASERAVLAKLSQDAWRKAQAAGPEQREKESEEAKEVRRIAKARLRGRRKNLDHSSLVVLNNTGDTLRPRARQTARQGWDKIRCAVKDVPKLKAIMEAGPKTVPAPSPESDRAQPSQVLRQSRTAKEVFHATLAGEDRLGSLLGMHLRRAFAEDEAKRNTHDSTQDTTPVAQTRPQKHANDVESRAAEIDSGSTTRMEDSESTNAKRRRARPLSAGLRNAVALRTGRKLDAVAAPVDTALISAFARRQKQEREGASLALNRLREELEDARQQNQSQTQAIEHLQTRVDVLKRHRTASAPNGQHRDLTRSELTTASVAARTLIARPTRSEKTQPVSLQIRACEQAVASASAGDFVTVMSILNTSPQSATVVDPHGEATLLHRLLTVERGAGLTCQIIKRLLSIHPTAIKCGNGDGQLPAHVALSNPSLRYQVVLAVLNAWPQATLFCDSIGQTPLHKAVAASWPADILQAVLDAGSLAASLQDRDGQLPLHIACSRDSPASLLRCLVHTNSEALLKKDAQGCTPLHRLVARDGKHMLDAYRVLCNSPTAVPALRIPNASGDRPLHIAVARSIGADVCKVLLQTDVSTAELLNSKGLAPIHIAVKVFCRNAFSTQLVTRKPSNIAEHLDIFVHSCPESIAVPASDGRTALHLLLHLGAGTQAAAVSIIDKIVATSPAAVIATEDRRDTALMVAVRNVSLPRVIRTLAASCPDLVLQKDADGKLPANVCVELASAGAPDKGPAAHKATLQAAARLRALVEVSPDALRARSASGETPLLTACEGKAGAPIAIISVILELDRNYSKSDELSAVFDTNPSYGGDSALHLLMKSSTPKLSAVRMLLDASDKLALTKNAAGTTPLHLALVRRQVEATMNMLSSCPAAAAVPDEDGQYPLHLAIQNQHPSEVVKALMDKFPAAASMHNKSGCSPLELALQTHSLTDTVSVLNNTHITPADSVPGADELISVAFNAVLSKTLVEEDRYAAEEHRTASRSILWKWHSARLLSVLNHATIPELSQPNVQEWQIRDVSIWIRFVALLPRQDFLSDTQIRTLAAGKWPPCEIADAMADSGVDGNWLLAIRDKSDLPPAVAASSRSSELLDAVRELWGLQRAMLARTKAKEDAAAVTREDTERLLDGRSQSQSPSVVYESLLDTGIALVLECKKQRQHESNARMEQNANLPKDMHAATPAEPAPVALPEPPSVFDRLGNEALYTGTQRFQKRHARKQRVAANHRFAVATAESTHGEETKIDRASVRAKVAKVREAAEQKFAAELSAAHEKIREQSLAREATTSPDLSDVLLERAIVIFLRCRQLDATDALPPYNLACCHALLATPDVIAASYWATTAFQLGMDAMDFASDEDLAKIQTPSFQRIIARAAEQVSVPDDAVQFVSVAATRIQATFRGYRARAIGQRRKTGEMR